MHWLDTTIVAALGLGAVLGFVSGLFWQIARIASLALAVVGTVLWHDSAVDHLRRWMLRDAEASIVHATAYIGVFLIVYIVMFLVTRILRGWLRATDLALPDRLLGGALGTAKIAVLVGVACLLLRHASHPTAQQALEQSSLAPVFAQSMEQAVALVPDDCTKIVLESFRQLQESVARMHPKDKSLN